MAGAWTTMAVKDGGGTSRNMRVWDESGAGTGPFSFGQTLTDGTSSTNLGHVSVSELVPGSGATDLGKAEDAAHTSGDIGVMALTVRKDTPAATAGTTGDYQPPITDANGRMYVKSYVENFNKGDYETVAASQTDQAMGPTGASGDFLLGILIVPATTSPGAVSIKDGSGGAITVFTGGATSVSNLVPFFVTINAKSGSGAWKVTTGANVSAIGIGDFT